MSLRLDWCSTRAMRYACDRWHYSRSVPLSPTVRIGVWEGPRFIGVVVFSRGASPHLGDPYGLAMTEVCELTRVALDTHETPTTRVVAIAVKMLRRHAPGLRLIVSFADPNHEHVGVLYQAGNWIYAGKTATKYEFRDRHGRVWHDRQVTAQGHTIGFAGRQVTPRRADCEAIPLVGKHRYLMPLDAAMRAQAERLRQPYPRAGSIEGDAPVVQTGEGGSIPTPALIRDELVARIQRALFADDANGGELRYCARKPGEPRLDGYCAVSAAAYLFLRGAELADVDEDWDAAGAAARAAGYRSFQGPEHGGHWWLERRVNGTREIVDLNIDDETPLDHYAHAGRPRGFMMTGYRRPSARALELIARVRSEM